jgi:hypothetical protein
MNSTLDSSSFSSDDVHSKSWLTKKALPAVKKALPVANKLLPVAATFVPALRPVATIVGAVSSL